MIILLLSAWLASLVFVIALCQASAMEGRLSEEADR